MSDPKKTILLIIADYTNLHNHVERPQKKNVPITRLISDLACGSLPLTI